MCPFRFKDRQFASQTVCRIFLKELVWSSPDQRCLLSIICDSVEDCANTILIRREDLDGVVFFKALKGVA